MKKELLLIRINKFNVVLIQLFKNDSHNSLPVLDFICQNQNDINSALNTVNLYSNSYNTKLIYI